MCKYDKNMLLLYDKTCFCDGMCCYVIEPVVFVMECVAGLW